MPDITTLGVGIDATDAESGAKKAIDAADQMGRKMPRDLDKVEKKSKKTGRSVKGDMEKMGRESKELNRDLNQLGNNRGFDSLRRGVAGGFGEIRSLIIDTLDVFGLLDNRLGQFVRRGDSLANIGNRASSSFGDMAAAGTNAAAATTNLGASGARAAGGMGGLLTKLGPMVPMLAAIAGGLLAVVVAFKAFQGAIKLIASGFPLAAAFEDAQVSLAVLMGSFEDAEARMREVEKFAAATPFETPELTETNRILQIFTDGALATTEGLTLIGDAAAAVDKPINEVGTWIGRLYAGLKGGQPIGEATARLLEMGALAPTVKGRLDALAASGNEGGANFAEIWALAEQSLQRFSGTMELRSKTWNGLLSSLSDNWGILRKEIAAPIMDALKPALALLVSLLEKLIPMARQFGETLATGIKGVVGIFQSGAIGSALKAGLTDAFGFGAKFGLRVLSAAVLTVVKNMLAGFKLAFKVFTALLSNPAAVGTFLQNLGAGMLQIVQAFLSGMLDVAAQFINSITGALSDFWNSTFATIDIGGFTPFGEASGTDLRGVGRSDSDFDPTGLGFTSFGTELAAQMSAGLDQSATGQLLQEQAEQFEINNPAPTIPGGAFDNSGVVLGGEGIGSGGAATGAADIKDATAALEDQRTALQTLADDWGNLEAQSDQALTGLVQGITGDVSAALTDAITGTKSWKEAFEELGASVVRQIIEMVTQLWVQYTVSMLLKNLGGAFGGGGGLGGVFGGAVLHTGGTADGAPQRSGRTPYFHSGGKASSERIAMLEKNESVLTQESGAEIRDRLRSASKRGSNGSAGSSTGVTIMNVTDPSQVAEVIAKNPDLIVNAINNKLPAVRRLVQNGNRR